MPLYEYRCSECGYFERIRPMVDHARADCPTCGDSCRQVLRSAPPLMIEAMADAGFPGAFHTSGDRMEKRHRQSGQYHTQTKAQKADADAAHSDFVNSVSITPKGE